MRLIPEELKQRKQWICWSFQLTNGKQTKVPVNPRRNGSKKLPKASCSNPQTWGTFEQAVHALLSYRYDGLGFVFTKEAGYTGIDLDHVTDSEEKRAWARSILERMNSYSEWSVSKAGLHILIKGTLSKVDGRRSQKMEIYSAGRFFAMSGIHIYGTPYSIEDRQAELNQLVAEMFPVLPFPAPAPVKPVSTPTTLSNDQVLDKARACANGALFQSAWAGETTPWGGDHSAMDYFLVCCLAFWTGHNQAQMDELFRLSGAMRPKWDRKTRNSTYGLLTLEKACSQTLNRFQTSGRKAC